MRPRLFEVKRILVALNGIIAHDPLHDGAPLNLQVVRLERLVFDLDVEHELRGVRVTGCCTVGLRSILFMRFLNLSFIPAR